MGIFHIVLFQFKDGVLPQEVQKAHEDMLALKDRCVHPTTNNAYIKTSIGGKENSLEGLQNGITHCFIVEFESEEDRAYYVQQDPAHAEFKKGVKEFAAKIIVVDFMPGVF